MVFVLCEEGDHSALWAADRLLRAGLSTTIVFGSEFAAALRWEHRVGDRKTGFSVQFPGGRRLDDADAGGVLNRLSFVPSAWLSRIGGPDKEYAVQEMFAFYLSWLHSLPGPVLNRPSPQGLCGAWRHPSAWFALAGRAGLPVEPYRQSEEDDPDALWRPPADPQAATVHVVKGSVVAPAGFPASIRAPCLRLAEAAGADLLGIEFATHPGGKWRFRSASPMPDLICGGQPLADALTEVFRS